MISTAATSSGRAEEPAEDVEEYVTLAADMFSFAI
jgi:hypothetical protein